MKYKILIVDDNRQLVDSLSMLLEMENFEVLQAYNGMQALELFQENEVDLILLDIMMPKMNGLEALMKLRTMEKVPVIILSAKSEEQDIVTGLMNGADDYITKPYGKAELMARIHAQIRRYHAWKGGIPSITSKQWVNGALVLDQEKKCIIINGNEMKLTPKEYGILELMMTNLGKVFSATEIYEHVWNEKVCFSVENTVMVHIRKLREKIEVVPKNPQYIKVVWGIGYKMENHNS